MRKDQVHLGHTYVAKISDQLTRVRIDGENTHGGWDATNLSTHKKVRIKSPAKLRGPAPDRQAKPRTKAVAEAPAADVTPNAPAVHQTAPWPAEDATAPAVNPAAVEANAEATAEGASEGAVEPSTPATSAETKAKKPKSPKVEKSRKPSGLDAAAKVLAEAGAPMHCKAMVEQMLAKGYWSTNGKTPAATIYSAILREIDTKPGESRFTKTDRGLFGLAKAKA